MAQTTYEKLPDGRTKETTTNDDETVTLKTLPVVRRDSASGKRPTQSRGIDTGSLNRSAP